jgi:hypothetical protein
MSVNMRNAILVLATVAACDRCDGASTDERFQCDSPLTAVDQSQYEATWDAARLPASWCSRKPFGHLAHVIVVECSNVRYVTSVLADVSVTSFYDQSGAWVGVRESGSGPALCGGGFPKRGTRCRTISDVRCGVDASGTE